MKRITCRAWWFLGLSLGPVVGIGWSLLTQATFVGFSDPGIVQTTESPIQGIWFTPNGALIAISHSGLIVTRRVIDPFDEKRTRGDNFDFGVILKKIDPNADLPLELSTNQSAPIGLEGKSGACLGSGQVIQKGDEPTAVEKPKNQILFTISDDGEDIAWVQGHKLTIGSFDQILRDPQTAPRLTIPLGEEEEIRALVLTRGSSFASLINANRVLTTYEGLKLLPFSLVLPQGSWRLGPHGPNVPTTDFLGGRSGVVTLDLSPTSDFPIRWIPNSVLSGCEPAIATDGKMLALGNRNGLVAFTELKPNEREVKSLSLAPGKRIRSIALLGDGDLLAAGDFPGIYLVTKKLLSQLVAFSPEGVEQIATSKGHLAYTTSREVVLMRRTGLLRSLRLTEDGKYGIGICFALLGFLGFLRGCLADREPAA